MLCYRKPQTRFARQIVSFYLAKVTYAAQYRLWPGTLSFKSVKFCNLPPPPLVGIGIGIGVDEFAGCFPLCTLDRSRVRVIVVSSGGATSWRLALRTCCGSWRCFRLTPLPRWWPPPRRYICLFFTAAFLRTFRTCLSGSPLRKGGLSFHGFNARFIIVR